MIDLNDVFSPRARHDLRAIKARLADTAGDWLPALFPEARLTFDKRALRCADLTGRPAQKEGSCILHIEGPYAGWGFDFATGERAGPVDLIYHATGMRDGRLFDEAARLAHMDEARITRPRSAARPKPDHALEIRRIRDDCQPLAGSVAETYLQSRGLKDPCAPDLLFHADLTDYESRRGWPGMVAIPRLIDGSPVGGIHRTFLLEDGSGKAPAGKKMLGTIADAAVRLFPLPEDWHLGVAEGIETALAAHVIFGTPVWAALSADGLARFKWPEGTRHVTIYADAGDAGRQAAATLSDRLNIADIPNRIVTPRNGDDFNDDLIKGAVRADYDTLPSEVEPGIADVPATTSEVSPEKAADTLTAETEALTNPPDLTALGALMGRIVKARLEPMEERHLLSLIKIRTGIAISILDKQLGVLRRRLNSTGDLIKPAARPAWANRLRLDLSGTPERNEANVIMALNSDPAFAGVIAFDEFAQKVVVLGALPWHDKEVTYPRPWDDSDDIRAAEWLQHREVNVAPLVVGRSVGAVARDIRIHPVRAYLQSLIWDGTPRLESWTSQYLGAAPTDLTHAMGGLWLISAVARIFRPGVKADHMLILEGEQGARKSTALKILAGEEWFTDELPDLGSKDAAIHMQGVWIVEIAELDAIGRAEVSRIKAFLTRTTDRFRPPYGRHTVEIKRQCVFAGTVNPDTYLRDETGNRRFWPIRCGDIDVDGLARDRDQLWAEAVHQFKAGAIWWLEDKKLLKAARDEQDKRYQSDAWDGLIDRWLTHEKRSVNRGYAGFDDWQDEEFERAEPLNNVSVGEILADAIGIEPARWTKPDQMRAGSWLKSRNWKRYQRRTGEAREWRYRKETD
ncbi:MAG: P-loop ATPase [Alphaproteobacteria bacterium]|nr:P-loop ATPase [Alphaproteobacteria bacterium]